MLKLLALSLIASFAAHAAPVPAPSPTPGYGDIDVAAQCPELKLTQAQTDQIKALKTETATKLKAQKAQLKEQRKALMQSMADVNATQDSVVKQEQSIKASVDGILDTVFATANQVVFTVLTKEQRQPGVACFHKIRKELHKKILDKKCAARGGGSEEEEDATDIEM